MGILKEQHRPSASETWHKFWAFILRHMHGNMKAFSWGGGGGGMGGGVLASKCLFQTIAYIVKQLHIKDNSGVYSPKMKGAN